MFMTLLHGWHLPFTVSHLVAVMSAHKYGAYSLAEGHKWLTYTRALIMEMNAKLNAAAIGTAHMLSTDLRPGLNSASPHHCYTHSELRRTGQ